MQEGIKKIKVGMLGGGLETPKEEGEQGVEDIHGNIVGGGGENSGGGAANAAAVAGIWSDCVHCVSPRINVGLGILSLLGLLLVAVSVLVTPNASLYNRSTICACDTAMISYSQFVVIGQLLTAHLLKLFLCRFRLLQCLNYLQYQK